MKQFNDKPSQAELINFFTGKSSRDINKLSSDEEETLNEKGKYLGVLVKRDAERIRAVTDQLNLKKEQIDYLMTEWNELQQRYTEILTGALMFLGKDNPEVKKVNIETDSVYVDKSGHVWFIKKET